MLWDTKQYLLIEFIFTLIATVYFILKHCKLPVLFIQSRTNNSFVGPTQTPLSLSSLWFFGALIGFIGFESFFFPGGRVFERIGLFWPVPRLPIDPAGDLRSRGRRDDQDGSKDALWICERGSLQGGSVGGRC